MKILEVIPVFSDSFGGPVTVVRSIASELSKKHQVVVYTTTAVNQYHDSRPRVEYTNGYTVYYFERSFRFLVHSGLFGSLNTSLKMLEAIKNNLRDFDIVHVHSWQQFPDVLVQYYASKYDIPYILQVHGSLPRIGKKNLKLIFDILFGYRELNFASKVVAINQLEFRQYQSMHVPKNKISIIPNGITTSEFRVLPPKGSFKNRFGIDENTRIILFLGRVHRIKGLDILVKAFEKVFAVNKNVKLVIAGPDDGYLKQLMALVTRLGLNQEILFVGPLYGKNKLEAFVDSEVTVLPSRYEIWGMSILESLACGTPVVLSENCALAGYVNEKVGLVAKLDPINLANSLIDATEQTTQKKFRKNCALFIKQFDSSLIASEIERIYKDVKK